MIFNTSSHSALLSLYLLSASCLFLLVLAITNTLSPSSNGISSYFNVLQSKSNAPLSTPLQMINWSIIPLLTPINSFSTLLQAKAKAVPETGLFTSEDSAKPKPVQNEADDDKPDE